MFELEGVAGEPAGLPGHLILTSSFKVVQVNQWRRQQRRLPAGTVCEGRQCTQEWQGTFYGCDPRRADKGLGLCP